MSPDEELTAIARAIIERGHIDWLDVESSADEEVQRSTIRQLKVIAKIAELHRGIADVPASPGLPVTRLLERAPDPVESGPDLAAMPAVLWGPLKLLHRIANGSFGEVFLALDMRLEREVALKLLYQSGALADPVGSAVIEEARLLARVRHPNVVTIYGADRIDNRVGLWMEHVRGRTLQQALKERGRLDAAEVAVIGVEICGALSAVHEAGLLHRDVKAHNVMQQEDGRLVLMDFGAGHELADDGGAAELAGTPLYVAPEILEAQPATVQSDLYSLGVLLYHLLTGSYPVTGRTVREIREHHRSGQRKTIHDARSDVSQPLARAIERALDADQMNRFHSAREMAVSLGATTKNASANVRSHRPLILAVIAGVVIASAGLDLFLWRTGSPIHTFQVDRLFRGTDEARIAAANQPPSSARQNVFHFQPGDWVLLTAFDNLTGQDVLDGTVEFALERELAGSRFVNVAPRERVEDVLQLMRSSVDARVDLKLGREVAARDKGIGAVLSGSVERSGKAYVITVQIVDPGNGLVAASVSESAFEESQLMLAIRRLALRVREALGEVKSSLRADGTEADRATEPSLRVLQLYSRAVALMRGDHPQQLEPAEQLLKEALREDPRFASAHILLAWAIHNQKRPKEEFLPPAERANGLANQATRVERHFIVGSYHSLLSGTVGPDTAAGQLQQAMVAYKALVAANPAHPWGLNNLWFVYWRLGLESSVKETIARLVEVRPASLSLRLQLATRFLETADPVHARAQLADAEDILRSAGAVERPEFVQIQLLKVKAAWVDRDVSRARQLLDDAARARTIWPDDSMLRTVRQDLVFAYAELGRLGDARRIAANSPPVLRGELEQYLTVVAATAHNPPDRKALRAYWSKWLLDVETANRNLNVNELGIPYYVENLIDAGMTDDLHRAVTWVRENGRGGPPSNRLDIEGQFALAEGRVDEGVHLLQAARGANPPQHRNLRIAVLLADALKTRGQMQEAVSVLEDVTRNGWPQCILMTTPPGCIAAWIRLRDRLADLYEQNLQTTEAKAVNEELLKLLAEADIDYPLLVRVKSRTANVHQRKP